MKLKIETQAIMVGIAIVALCAVLGMFELAGVAKANVITQGIIPQVATSSTVVIGPQNTVTISSRQSNCTGRVISTLNQSIMLSFLPGITPTSTQGHIQATSTTVSYDNANYGCGIINGWAQSSTTITVTGLSQ